MNDCHLKWKDGSFVKKFITSTSELNEPVETVVGC